MYFARMINVSQSLNLVARHHESIISSNMPVGLELTHFLRFTCMTKISSSFQLGFQNEICSII